MSTWIELGSPKDIQRQEMRCLNAYMFWIEADCNSMNPADARARFSKELWWVMSQHWINSMILTQDPTGLKAMRDDYTKKTGKDWKTASLNSVKDTLGFCPDLYEQGKVLINAKPNLNAILINDGLDMAKEPIRSVIKKMSGSFPYPESLEKRKDGIRMRARELDALHRHQMADQQKAELVSLLKILL